MAEDRWLVPIYATFEWYVRIGAVRAAVRNGAKLILAKGGSSEKIASLVRQPSVQDGQNVRCHEG